MFGKLFRKPAKPRSVVGQWLYAAAMREDDAIREPLLAELRRTGWIDAAPVVAAACELVVSDAYGPNATTKDVPELVSGLRAFFSTDGVERFSQDHGERLIRKARGEDVAVGDIPPADAMIVHGLTVVALVRDLKYSKAEATQLVIDAENIAMSRGFHLTVASISLLPKADTGYPNPGTGHA